MVYKLFNSSFAKNSKFDKDFVGNITNIDQWYILVNQYKNFLKNNFRENNIYIPKNIHQIWLGDKDLPKQCIKWMLRM